VERQIQLKQEMKEQAKLDALKAQEQYLGRLEQIEISQKQVKAKAHEVDVTLAAFNSQVAAGKKARGAREKQMQHEERMNIMQTDHLIREQQLSAKQNERQRSITDLEESLRLATRGHDIVKEINERHASQDHIREQWTDWKAMQQEKLRQVIAERRR
jgi:uncharacterized protein YbdZ (MbtH family)